MSFWESFIKILEDLVPEQNEGMEFNTPDQDDVVTKATPFQSDSVVSTQSENDSSLSNADSVLDKSSSVTMQNEQAKTINDAVFIEDPIEPIKSIAQINLGGRKLFNDLLADVKEATERDSSHIDPATFGAAIEERFTKTIQSTISGIGSDEIAEQGSMLTLEDQETLQAKIKVASEKLAQEMLAGNQTWENNQNSLTKAARERWLINVVGHTYDAIGSMCHSIAKFIGISKPTAAELFSDAAKFAKGLQDQLSVDQVARDTKHEREGYSYSLASLKNRRDDNFNPEAQVKANDAAAATAHFQKLIDQVGGKAALAALKVGVKDQPSREPELDEVGRKFEKFNSILKADNKDKLQTSDVFLAMAKVEKTLFPDDLVIAGKVHKVERDSSEIPEVMRKLETTIKKSGTAEQKQAFAEFKAEVKAIAPQDTWVGKISSTIGLSKSKSF